MPETFDVVVLGSGPGGYSAAFRAADLGQRVALVERYETLGGVCLHVGCIPSKALLHVAEVVEAARDLAGHGVGFGEPSFDLAALRRHKDAIVSRLTDGLRDLAKRRKVTRVVGTGRFASPHRILVVGPEGETPLDFHHAIVAVGSRAVALPGLPQDDRIMDSTGALELPDVPRRLLVVGGGIIGLEMAAVYAALGARVSVVELLDQLLPGVDADLVKPLRKRIEPRYEALWLGTRVTGVSAEATGLRVRLDGPDAPEEDVFDRILVAVGRRPDGESVAAERAGVRVDERGFLPVDAQLRTNVPHVFAIGDVARPPMLAHKAVHEGKVAAEVAAGEKSAFDARAIPSVAYTDPEVAWTGLTEGDAKERGVAYEKALFPWSASGRSLGLGRDEGLTKLLFAPDDGRLLGAGIVGPRAGDLIAEATLAVEMGADAHDLALTIHPHPTLSETLAFAAEQQAGTITDLMPKPKRTRKRA